MPKKILLVEDNAVHPSLNLEASNYQLIEASTANEGLNKALELKPQLILMDMDLPDLSGFELCKRMRAFYELKKVPIIIFSSENKLKNMVTAYEMGADYYIVKSEEGDRVLTLLIETIFTRLSRQNYPLQQYSA
jgi:DNA-binding response OmpR family regulator